MTDKKELLAEIDGLLDERKRLVLQNLNGAPADALQEWIEYYKKWILVKPALDGI
jgi:hypothetical protein